MSKKIGRNDRCPCGSGRKYKKCCINKFVTNKFIQWEINARDILISEPKNDDIVKIFFNVLDIIDRRDWKGACHATCAVLYVLFSEIGLKPTLCLGEVKYSNIVFDHSWIEISNNVYDAAIFKTIHGDMLFSPIINGVSVDTKQPPKAEYGIVSGQAISAYAKKIKNTSFEKYMSNYPERKNGLWDFVKIIAKKISLDVNIQELKSKYSNVKWSDK
ncbi:MULTISPECIES: YecA family protein [Halobacteroidaceae]|uniref:SEC-C motif-containing protein n=1 Tax=Orenia marismortui TaxID=46469 RepID=A0A4R8H1T8_9FIRM|nr:MULTISPECIES: SEC-C metal-binding domain-containing protein [Halobacteroidaceae]TDX48377.1 SEC-C motif-containing protein [Orenia marismortui]SDC76280.1 SEC-C motif-containing protein [Candidatus Frackibacter sp. WG11]SEM89757.1 SEC-C motif-containing protein [Candidatus Frackibacter sp. WG12]SFL99239.1 SEC-C motif-containing protein [Candidatus Frackibacter sp. WG13]